MPNDPNWRQHLDDANRVRLARSALLQQLARGEVTLEHCLNHEATRTAFVREVLRRQHGWGPARAEGLMRRADVSLFVRCGNLTDRQRTALLEQQTAKPTGKDGWCQVCEEPGIHPPGGFCNWCGTRLIDPGLAA